MFILRFFRQTTDKTEKMQEGYHAQQKKYDQSVGCAGY